LLPGLLDKFEYNFKTLTYVLRLRPNLKFQNGRDVHAKDLEFSLLRGFFSQRSSFYSVYLNNIDGLSEIEGKNLKYKSGLVSGIKIKDDRTVEVKLSHPNPSFLHALTNPFFSLVPQEALNKDLLSWKTIPIGAGPYRVMGKGFEGNKVSLELVDSSGTKAPKRIDLFTNSVPGVHFDVVMSPSGEEDISQMRAYKTEKPASIRTIFFNNENPLSKNQDFRFAVLNLINREDIAKDLEDLTASYEILPSHFWGRSSEKPPQNIEKAKKYLKKVPHKLLEGQLSVAMFAGKEMSPYHKKIAEHLEDQFRKVGLKIHVEANSEKFLSKESAKKFIFRVEGRVSDYVDPLIMFASLREGSAFKYDQPVGQYKIKFNELYNEAADAADFDSRIESVRKLSDFVQKEAIAVAIGEERITYWLNPKTVQSLGYQPQPLTLFLQNIDLK
jgi:ABC-type transport system substrate-binding protein